MKWNHTICGLYAWLLSLGMTLSRFIHVVHVAEFHPFLWLNNILLQTTIYLSVHLLMDIWVVFTFWLLWIMLL